MREAEHHNRVLEQHAPALARCLSPLGRRIAFPHGIPAQSEEAKSTRLNATIGQVTDGAGSPLPLPGVDALLGGLDRKMSLLYSPQPGHAELRRLWLDWQRAQAGDLALGAPISTPTATHGLTHGLGIAADLFCDADTTVVVPSPSWENYQLVFTTWSGARIVSWPFFEGGTFSVDALARALAGVRGRAVIVLNFPSNPTGYSPTLAEAEDIVRVVCAHPGPAVVVIDDAYQGVVHDEGLLRHSLYWQLAKAADPDRTFVLKIDGSTKELLFFPSRLGFLSASVTGPAEASFYDKVNAVIRGTVGSPPGPSQAVMVPLLRDADRTRAEVAGRLAEITARWRVLRDELHGVADDKIHVFPFNSAYFALVGLHASLDADAVRKRLIQERGVGTIFIPEVNGLRIAYCSMAERDIPELVRHLAEVVRS